MHRTLAVGRKILDMGYRSMVLANVSSILIYQPPRVNVAKLFFLLFAVIAGAIAGALYDVTTMAVATGACVGGLLGCLPFIAKPPTSLMITGSDGGAAVFESNDMQFLQRVKGFLDARINQEDLSMTGFFDFANSRYSALQYDGVYSGKADAVAPAAGAHDDSTYADDDMLAGDVVPPARPVQPPPAETQPRAAQTWRAPAKEPAPAREPAPPPVEIYEPAPEPEPEPEPDPAFAGLDTSSRTGHREDDIVTSVADGARAAHFEKLAEPPDDADEETDLTGDVADEEPQESTLPPIDFTRVMPQLAHVRRFYDETLQDADAVDQLDTMIVLMEEGAITQRSRQRIREIAVTMQSQVETYPSIASIFAGIASRVG
ncbi:MAG: hypothetical protein H6884_06410 [Rhodobiaceae bacterium]|nr:hypothetical protein [Rhodobiaceae bacterium]MCC0053674.1 hypothetical protein [Rhodobiaceae bacterium]